MFRKNQSQAKSSSAFTIVELLIVIVIIGILAAITIVSYRGITQRSVEASLQADLSNASKKLKLFQVDHNNLFPSTIQCDIPDSTTNLCLKTSSNNVFTYSYDNTANPPTFSIKASNPGSTIAYKVTDKLPPALYTSVGAPSSLTSIGGSSQSVLTWVAPTSSSSITNYKIYRSTTSNNETLLTTVGNVLTYTDTGLTAGTTYYYKILAVNADGDGDQSSEVSSMPTLTFNNTSTGYTGTIQTWTVPTTGTYTIEANGAQGGTGTYAGGLGARMKGSISLTAGQVIKILVGQQGIGNSYEAGGGGGTFVTDNSNNPLIVAGGGGGGSATSAGIAGVTTTSGALGGGSGSGTAGSSGGGGTGSYGASGGGLTGNGSNSTWGNPPSGGYSFISGGNGGAGVTSPIVGGFGGGGGAHGNSYVAGGGGGGYSGGTGGLTSGYGGGGGGSYNSGTNQSNTAGARSGQGLVTIYK